MVRVGDQAGYSFGRGRSGAKGRVGLVTMTTGGVKDGVVAGCWVGYCSRALGRFRVRRGVGGGYRMQTRCRVRERIWGEGG